MASIQLKFYSSSLKSRTNVNVLIPTLLPSLDDVHSRGQSFSAFYEGLPKKLPVLYLLHGTYGDEGDWQRFSRIEDYARSRNVIVVIPAGENSCYEDMPSGRNYETYLTQELPEMIEWMFPASPKREDRFICGLSMGGGSAFRLGLTHPDRYGYVISLSGAFDNIIERIKTHPHTVWSYAYPENPQFDNTPNDMRWLTGKAIKGALVPNLYIACGTEDFLYEDNCTCHQHLQAIGYEHVFHTKKGIHDWDFWDSEIREVLDWLPISIFERNAHL